MADIALDLVGQLRLLDILNQLVQIYLIRAAALQKKIRVGDTVFCLGILIVVSREQ